DPGELHAVLHLLDAHRLRVERAAHSAGSAASPGNPPMNTTTRGLVALIAVTYVVSGFSRTLLEAQTAPSTIRGLEVRPHIPMLAGAGGNITVQTGTHGVLLVDTPPATIAKQVLAQIATIGRAPIRYVIDTSSDAEHVGGNAAIAATGAGGGGTPFGPNRALALGTAQ